MKGVLAARGIETMIHTPHLATQAARVHLLENILPLYPKATEDEITSVYGCDRSIPNSTVG